MIAESTDGDTMVFGVPQTLIDALAVLQEAEEEQVAKRWAQREEFQLSGWLTADVEEYLHGLIQYAKQAKAAGKALLLWVAV